MQNFDYFNEDDAEWLSDLELNDDEVDPELFDWPETRAREFADTGHGRAETARRTREPRLRNGRSGPIRSGQERTLGTRRWPDEDPDDDFDDYEADLDQDDDLSSVIRTGPRPSRAASRRRVPSAQARTQGLIDGGRRSAGQRRMSRSRMTVIAVAGLLVLITAASLYILRSRPSWPASVATVRQEIATACQDPDVASEPGQVNFACENATSQILWIFALMTSNDNAQYTDAKTGRVGLEPITPTQGGEVAWSLNLHHAYNPYDPVDSLAVAARAINNIIGGATLTSANGKPAVQPGLEGNAQNCERYTGSPALLAHAGFPDVCAEPVSSSTGQAALVADAYRRWVIGSTAAQANEVSILFQNANNPGNPMVQAILKTLPASR